jgi:hypothetical protein
MRTERPVKCVSCQLTFLSVNVYLHPTHRCVVSRHPSGRNLKTMQIGLEKGPA